MYGIKSWVSVMEVIELSGLFSTTKESVSNVSSKEKAIFLGTTWVRSETRRRRSLDLANILQRSFRQASPPSRYPVAQTIRAKATYLPRWTIGAVDNSPATEDLDPGF